MNMPPISPGDLWAIRWDRAESHFAGHREPRTLEALGIQAREKSSHSGTQTATAVIPVLGPIAKDPWIEMYGGTSALRTQEAVAAAAASDEVDSLLLLIDSPGGAVAGIEELAHQVAGVSKPVHAHVDDLGASAAYWIASQADTISTNASGEVGSIGVLAVVADISKMLENEGIKMHVIRSGDAKAPFAAGLVTDEGLTAAQERVDAIADQFLYFVASGRGDRMGADALADVMDGRVVGASEALELGLVDSIATRRDAFGGFRKGVDSGHALLRRANAALERAGELRARA